MEKRDLSRRHTESFMLRLSVLLPDISEGNTSEIEGIILDTFRQIAKATFDVNSRKSWADITHEIQEVESVITTDIIDDCWDYSV